MKQDIYNIFGPLEVMLGCIHQEKELCVEVPTIGSNVKSRVLVSEILYGLISTIEANLIDSYIEVKCRNLIKLLETEKE